MTKRFAYGVAPHKISSDYCWMSVKRFRWHIGQKSVRTNAADQKYRGSEPLVKANERHLFVLFVKEEDKSK